MNTLTIILAGVMFSTAVVLILLLRQKRIQHQSALKQLAKLQDENDSLLFENLCFQHYQQEYCLKNNKETSLFGCPPVFRFGSKEYRPVVKIGRADGKWQLTLVGAEIYVEDFIGDEDCRLVVMHYVDRISAEEYDDFLCQLYLGIWN